jgi:hypothetical protein
MIPILFCIYNYNLLLDLSSSTVGRCIGLNFVSALAYADNTVLITPTSSATCKMFYISNDCAS